MSRVFTREELAEFDGLEGRPAYVAYGGKVYDLTNSGHVGEGVHYQHEMGTDLTNDIEDAPHEAEVLDDFPIVGELEEE